MDSDDILMGLKRRDETALSVLFDTYYEKLYLFAEKYIYDSDKAHDIVQDVFAALWLQHDNFNNYYTIRSFLYISVRNRSLNLLKKNSLTTEKMIRVQQNSLSEAQESEMVIETEVERRLMAAVEALPTECRRVLILSMEGKSYQEIGELLHIAINTVKNHRIRAVKKLREKML